MASTSDGIEEKTTKKRRARPDFAERKVRQKQSVYTTVKTGWRKFCKDKRIAKKIDEAVQLCSRIACEAYMLASVHVLRLLEAGEELPSLDNNFFNRCTSAIANLVDSGKIHSDLETSRNIYMDQHPSVYEPTEKKSYMTQMLVMIAQHARQNFQIRLHNSDYFENHQDKIIKSAVSLLVRASTQTQHSLSNLIPAYSRFKKYPIPTAEIVWIQELSDRVRNEIEPLPLDLNKSPERHMPFLRTMLKDIQAHVDNGMKGCRGWSLLPQKQFKPIFIKINITVLKELAKTLSDPVELYADKAELWRTYFNIGLVIIAQRKELVHFISTDGMSVGVPTSRPKLPTREQKEIFSLEDRVIGLDPRRKKIFTGVVYKEESMATLQKPKGENVKYEVIHWVKDRFYRECGYHRRTKLTKEWIDAEPDIKAFNENVPSAKIANLVSYLKQVRFCLVYLDRLLDVYSSRRMKRLRWSTYIRRQQTYEKVVKNLTGGNKRTVIAYGDASFTSSAKGNIAISTTIVRKKIGSRCRVADVDEFRMSKLCCACHKEMKGYVLDEKIGGKGLYGVQHCKNSECHRVLWDRDINAAINILRLFIEQVKKKNELVLETKN